MKPNLTVYIQAPNHEKGYQMVNFSGEFDKAGHSEVRETISKCVNDFQEKDLIFDFSNLKFINSEGIGYLMEIHTHLKKHDRRLIVIDLQPQIKDVFDTIGISAVIPVYKDLNFYQNIGS